MLASGFNLTATEPAPDGRRPEGESGPDGWFSEGEFGLDQGMIVLMIENFRSGLLWRLNRRSTYIQSGLRRAGFRGGWL